MQRVHQTHEHWLVTKILSPHKNFSTVQLTQDDCKDRTLPLEGASWTTSLTRSRVTETQELLKDPVRSLSRHLSEDSGQEFNFWSKPELKVRPLPVTIATVPMLRVMLDPISCAATLSVCSDVRGAVPSDPTSLLDSYNIKCWTVRPNSSVPMWS